MRSLLGRWVSSSSSCAQLGALRSRYGGVAGPPSACLRALVGGRGEAEGDALIVRDALGLIIDLDLLLRGVSERELVDGLVVRAVLVSDKGGRDRVLGEDKVLEELAAVVRVGAFVGHETLVGRAERREGQAVVRRVDGGDVAGKKREEERERLAREAGEEKSRGKGLGWVRGQWYSPVSLTVLCERIKAHERLGLVTGASLEVELLFLGRLTIRIKGDEDLATFAIADAVERRVAVAIGHGEIGVLERTGVHGLAGEDADVALRGGAGGDGRRETDGEESRGGEELGDGGEHGGRVGWKGVERAKEKK